MAWQIDWSKAADRDLGNFGSEEKRRIVNFMETRVAGLENPRDLGEALKAGKLGHLWRYRVGDYRVLASIEDELVKILVVAVDHRREVYR